MIFRVILLLVLWLYPVLGLGAATIEQVEPLAKQAISALEQGDFAKSEKFWTDILTINPQNSAVWSNRGNVRLSQNKLEESIADFSRSIELTPDIPDPYLNRGIAFERLEQWNQAIADYDRVLVLNPKDAYGYNNRGNAKAGKLEWQEALKDYLEASMIDPKFAFARANSAIMRYQLGEDDQAFREVRSLVRKYPNFADMRATLTTMLWHQEKRGEAESNWVAVMGLDDRYKDINWIKTIRRWPPRLVAELSDFLQLK